MFEGIPESRYLPEDVPFDGWWDSISWMCFGRPNKQTREKLKKLGVVRLYTPSQRVCKDLPEPKNSVGSSPDIFAERGLYESLPVASPNDDPSLK
jgi:hypothetical protein